MRLIALIGILILLLMPLSFAIASNDTVDITRNFTTGFFWTSNFGDGGDSDTDTFKLDWITEENNVYESYFGDGLNLAGAAILVLLILGLIAAITDSDSKKSAYVLILCGIALLVLRYLALDDLNSGFYKTSDDGLGGTNTYTEVPLGFIFALIFGLISARKS